jgi:hypothetical protein
MPIPSSSRESAVGTSTADERSLAPRPRGAAAAGLLASLILSSPLIADEATDPAATAVLEAARAPKPDSFAIVFSLGYGGDTLPADDASFEKLLEVVRAAGYDTVLTTYTPTRLEIVRKLGLRMMVDLLAVEQHHVYKSPDKARAICEKLRGDPAVWGYDIWNDPVRKTGPGRRRDINTVRTWDPTHPAYSGTYRTEGMRHLTNADILGYYDFHWARGLEQHFGHLIAFGTWARERDARFYAWLGAKTGDPGEENFRRARWSANTSIACGLKGILWFLGTELIDLEKLEWNGAGQDIARVNAEIAPISAELARLGNPVAVWSTPITKSPANEIVAGAAPIYPPGLEGAAIPADAAIAVLEGQIVIGVYEDGEKRTSLYVANLNALADDEVVIAPRGGAGIEIFDRGVKAWKALEATDGRARFPISAGAGELLRLEVAKSSASAPASKP